MKSKQSMKKDLLVNKMEIKHLKFRVDKIEQDLIKLINLLNELAEESR